MLSRMSTTSHRGTTQGVFLQDSYNKLGLTPGLFYHYSKLPVSFISHPTFTRKHHLHSCYCHAADSISSGAGTPRAYSAHVAHKAGSTHNHSTLSLGPGLIMASGNNVLLIALPFEVPKDVMEKLQQAMPHYQIRSVAVSVMPSKEELESKLPAASWKDVAVLVTFTALPEHVKDAPKLQLVHLTSAGSNYIVNSPIYTDTEITFTNSTGIHGPQIAEWVVMTRLGAAHQLRKLYELQKDHQWGTLTSKTSDGREKTTGVTQDQPGRRMGILGYGSIGRQIGRMAKALGMELLAFTATPKDTPEKRKDHGYIVPGTGDPEGQYPDEWFYGMDKANLHHFLSQKLDWLVITLPLTKETTHMLGSEEFDILSKDGRKPYLTNIARGPVVVTKDLIQALKSDQLCGAALDVTDPEPLPADNELWDAPNITITPHISGHSDAYFHRSFEILRMNLQSMEAGKPLLNVVKRHRGY